MQRLLATFSVAILSVSTALAQDAAPAKAPATSPLLEKGALADVQKQLEKIFSFTIEDSRLQIDRRAWNAAAKDIPKLPDPFMGRLGEAPAIETLFLRIQEAAGASGSGRSITGTDRRATFTGDKLSGQVRTRGDYVRLTLEEAQAPLRTLELTIEAIGAYRIQVSEGEGDQILLSQAKNGRFTAVAIVGGETFTGRGESFAAFFKEHRRGFDAHILPALDALGIKPVPSSSAPDVRKAVVALLSRKQETVDEGKKLLGDLEEDAFAVRQKAAQQLSDRYVIYQDLIQEKLKEKLTLEVKKRLEKIVAEHADAGRVTQALTALGLLQDPAYLISLLELVSAEEVGTLTTQLEKVTGEKLGSDIATWKAWAKKHVK